MTMHESTLHSLPPEGIRRLRERIQATTRRTLQHDRIAQGAVMAFSALMLVPLLFILAFISVKGISHITPQLFLNDQRDGGILNAIAGTFLMVLLASILAVPMAVVTGLYLAESPRKKRIPEFIRLCVDVLQGIPSIIVGIVSYAWLVVPFRSFSGIAGAISLCIMMLPIIIKNTEESLKLVPATLREAGHALGVPRHMVLLQVVLPAGLSGITTGVLVAVARVMGETAPLLFTAFGSRDMNLNLGKPMEALPPLIYKYASSPREDWVDTAWAASFLLVVFVILLNFGARMVMKKWKATH